jgi:hypothetical protein
MADARAVQPRIFGKKLLKVVSTLTNSGRRAGKEENSRAWRAPGSRPKLIIISAVA